MKRVIIIVQSLLIVISLGYAFVKQVEASKNFEEAERQRTLADKYAAEAAANLMEAVRQEQMGNEQRATAVKLETQLKECCKKK